MYSNRKLKKVKVRVNKVKRLSLQVKLLVKKKVVLDFLAQEEGNLPFGIDSPVKSPCTTTNRQRQDRACP